jgi:hypothetical protein
MRTFTDNAGHEWHVVVNVTAIKRVRALAGVFLVDIVEPGEAGLYARLLADPVLVVDVAYGVCQPEAESRKITRPDFEAALVGDAIAAAREAVLDELADFFPNPPRENLRRALAASRGAAKMSGDSAGTVPAPSASTPAG